MCPTTLRRVVESTAFAVTLLVAAALLPGTALAHEGEESDASQTVLQAIALLVSSPGDIHLVEDKVREALAEAREEPDGESALDVDLLARAAAALEESQPGRARHLLQRSLGAHVDLAGTDVQPILHLPDSPQPAEPAKAAATGTSVVTDHMPGRGPLGAADYALLVLGFVLAGVGLWVSVRTRPAHSIHELRHPPAPGVEVTS